MKKVGNDKNIDENLDENLVESASIEAENLREAEAIESENLRERALGEAESIIESALGEAENLIESTTCEAENLIESTRVEAENLIQSAMAEVNILKERTAIEVNSVRENARVGVENLKKTARVTDDNLKKTARVTAEHLKKTINMESENLKKTARVTDDNLKKTARVTAEHLKKTINMESENLKKTARVTADNLMDTARVTAEHLKKTARVTADNLMETARVTAEHLKKTARVTADNLMETARIHSSQSLKNTHEKLEKIKDHKKLQLNKKHVILITTACIFLIGGSVFYLNQQPKHIGLMSEYLIENIKGEKINTWTAWNIVEGDTFHIHVLASPEVTPERLKVIEDVIFSNETVTVGDLKYYKGWQEALIAATGLEHKLAIPVHFDVAETSIGSGNIIIKLSSLENADGYTGYTESIADAAQHQILKSEITVYGVDKINNDELAIILRHELGHGFGLGHSDDKNDLMFQNVQTFPPYEYISECDVEAMAGLYNGNEKSQVTCTK